MRWEVLAVLLIILYFMRPLARTAGKTVGVYKAASQPQPPPAPAPAAVHPLAECYRTLELQPTASLDEVKVSYRELVKVWHPDRFGSDAKLREKATKKMSEINDAYEKIVGKA